jgi:hypothetical protein
MRGRLRPLPPSSVARAYSAQGWETGVCRIGSTMKWLRLMQAGLTELSWWHINAGTWVRVRG